MEGHQIPVFLLYCGPLVLKGILPDNLLKQFLLLHVSCRILCSKQLCSKYLTKVESYLEKFVLLSIQLYGLSSAIFNVHNIVHLAEDVKNLNCTLSQISAFPFENLLGKMKRSLNSGYKPLEQFVGRAEAQSEIDSPKVVIPSSYEILKPTLKQRTKMDAVEIKRIRYINYTMDLKESNNTVLLENGDIISIERMFTPCSKKIDDVNNIFIVGKKYKIVGSAFDFPDVSSKLDIFRIQVNEKAISQQYSLSKIKCKIVLLKIYELIGDEIEMYAVPMLHTE